MRYFIGTEFVQFVRRHGMDEQERVTVEDVRKLALPLGTRVIAGNGMLSRAVSWATVIYPENDTLPKSIQQDEMILVATPETGKRSLNHSLMRGIAESYLNGAVLPSR